MDSVSVEVMGLEELGPELLFTEGNNSIAAMDCLYRYYITKFGLTLEKLAILGERWIVKIINFLVKMDYFLSLLGTFSMCFFLTAG
jgi:hypothetical protein